MVAAPILLFLLVFRPVRQEIEAGYQGAARANPYLAAERLFTRMGVPAETVRGDVNLPPSGSTVVLLGPQPLPSNHDLDSLLAWVEDGGRLVATPAGTASFDSLLEHFGVVAIRPQAAEGPPSGSRREEVVEIAGLEEAGPLRVSVPRGSRLRLASAAGGEDPGDRFLRRFERGQGEVILLADGTFLRNDAIGRHDHARLAGSLVYRHTAGHPVAVLVVRDRLPSLAALLGRHAWPALVSGGVLLLAWLRFASARFGPLLPEPSRDRRRLLEHVEAAGTFLWRHGEREALLSSTRRAVLGRIHLREPAWEKLPRAELVRRAAAVAKLDPPAVARALYGPAPADAQGFVQCSQILETVRRSL